LTVGPQIVPAHADTGPPLRRIVPRRRMRLSAKMASFDGLYAWRANCDGAVVERRSTMRKTMLFFGATLLSFVALLPVAARAHIRSTDASACRTPSAGAGYTHTCGLTGGDDFGAPTTVYFDYSSNQGNFVDLYFVRTTYSGSVSVDYKETTASYTGSFDTPIYPSTTIQGSSPYDYYSATFHAYPLDATVYGVALRN
jgi:hypothetical protein